MIEELKVLAVVPARGGSKGLKGKNLKVIGNLSLVELALDAALSSSYIDTVCVSTDDPKIAEVANRHLAGSAPFTRPSLLSGDLVSDYPVVRHALETMELLEAEAFDVVVMLQPTSPLRTPTIIDRAVEKLVYENCDSVWSVSEVDLKHHPLKQLQLTNGTRFDYYLESGCSIIARQQLTKTFIRNGMCYAVARSTLMDQDSIKGKNSHALITPGPAVSIDSQADLDFCRSIL